MTSDESKQLTLDLPADQGADRVSGPRLAAFRPIHYLGSKLRLAPAIAEAIDNADATRGTVLDLFAGSGTTAFALSGHRTVLTSDIQEYSRVICSALLSPRPTPGDLASSFAARLAAGSPIVDTLRDAIEPLIEFERGALLTAARGDAEPICAVLEEGSILANERGLRAGTSLELQRRLTETTSRLARAGLAGSAVATTVRYFGGAYFSYEQALELDCVAAISSEGFPPSLRDLFTAALLSTASDTVNTVGKQFAQPIRPKTRTGGVKKHLLAKLERDRKVSVQIRFLNWLARYASHSPPGTKHVAIRADYREALRQFAGEYSVVYADPPYTRDHYSRFYHVLETIARRDNPPITRSPGAAENDLSRGMYRDDRHQSPFCIRSQAAGAFRELFQLASDNGANMVLSYSPFQSGAHPRLMQIEALLELARRFYGNVELERVDGVSHSKLNRSSLNFEMPPEAEVLIICRLTQ